MMNNKVIYERELKEFKECHVHDINVIETKNDIICYMSLISMRYDDKLSQKFLDELQQEFERIYDMERQN